MSLFVSKVFSTHRTGTHPEKTFTKRLKRDFFHHWFGGLPGVCSTGVLKQPSIVVVVAVVVLVLVVLLVEYSPNFHEWNLKMLASE